eukprot:Hpha_TRINITY_DN7128_c0_g1::TRINITY_DN7128_c0_g1_i1::g.29791::m.29791
MGHGYFGRWGALGCSAAAAAELCGCQELVLAAGGRVFLLALASVVLLAQSASDCLRDRCGDSEVTAAAAGAVSLLSLLVAPRAVRNAVLPVLWLGASARLTFQGRYAEAGNGYFALLGGTAVVVQMSFHGDRAAAVPRCDSRVHPIHVPSLGHPVVRSETPARSRSSRSLWPAQGSRPDPPYSRHSSPSLPRRDAASPPPRRGDPRWSSPVEALRLGGSPMHRALPGDTIPVPGGEW